MKMTNPRNIPFLICSMFLFALLSAGGVNAAVNQAPNAAHAAVSVDQSGKDMTLWQLLVAGGSVMIVIGFLSFAAVALIIYEFKTLKVEKLAPRQFFENIVGKLEERNLNATRDLCTQEKENLIAKIVLAGLDKTKKKPGDILVREAMEHRARIEIGGLWQNLNYLSDIVAVAPLLGLLGTVLGMIQAFHAVPLQSAGAKTALLSAGISKAMVTTAAGLIVAIPVLMSYSYFRGKVQEVTNTIEIYVTDIIKIMENL